MKPERGRPWLRALWLIPLGWALSLVGIYIDAYSDRHTRLDALEFAGPVFTGVAIYLCIQRYSQHRKELRREPRTDGGEET